MFYLFGSENSQDYDVLVNINNIPENIDEAHKICKYWNDKLSEILPDKELNCNLITISDNKIIDCFKGTLDELNNCLFYTYKHHKQFYDNPILLPIERNLNHKILRVARYLITFYSRTELRTEIKAALRGNLLLKLAVLKKIDYTLMTEFPNKKEKYEDIWKVIAFQFGQLFSIIDGVEYDSYTRNGIIKHYPDLKVFLNRKPFNTSDLEALNGYLNRFITYIESNIDNLKLLEN